MMTIGDCSVRQYSGESAFGFFMFANMIQSNSLHGDTGANEKQAVPKKLPCFIYGVSNFVMLLTCEITKLIIVLN